LKFTLDGENMLKKTVSKCGNGGVVYVPKDWVGHKIAVILLNEEDEK